VQRQLPGRAVAEEPEAGKYTHEALTKSGTQAKRYMRSTTKKIKTILMSLYI
jgi:hypothetical protein